MAAKTTVLIGRHFVGGRFADYVLISGESCAILLAHRMKRSLHVPIAPGRILSAWVCLLAVLLLWTPMWAAAWQAGRMACCNGGMCPAHGRSKPSPQHSQRGASQESPMNCGHERGSGLGLCAMSCCQSESGSFVTSIVFVLPPSLLLSRSPRMVNPSIVYEECEILPAITPPDRPPRLLPA